MAGTIQLDPAMIAGAAAISFLVTGSVAACFWWCECSCPCCRRTGRADRYRDAGEDIDDGEAKGRPVGKAADTFLSDWESKFQQSLQSPAANKMPVPMPSGPPKNLNASEQRRASSNADRLVAMAQRRVAATSQRSAMAASTRHRRLSLEEDDADKVLWLGHGSKTQRKTLAELRDIAREEQQERMDYLRGFVDGDSGRKPRKRKEHRSASSDAAEAPRPQPPTASRANSAAPPLNNDFSDIAGLGNNNLSDMELSSARFGKVDVSNLDMSLREEQLDLTIGSSRSAPVKPKRKASRRSEVGAARSELSESMTMSPGMLSVPSAQRSERRRHSGQSSPRAPSRRGSGSKREPRRLDSDDSGELPRRPKRNSHAPTRGRSTSPRPSDEVALEPPGRSSMPPRVGGSRRTGKAADAGANPDWPGMMNF